MSDWEKEIIDVQVISKNGGSSSLVTGAAGFMLAGPVAGLVGLALGSGNKINAIVTTTHGTLNVKERPETIARYVEIATKKRNGELTHSGRVAKNRARREAVAELLTVRVDDVSTFSNHAAFQLDIQHLDEVRRKLGAKASGKKYAESADIIETITTKFSMQVEERKSFSSPLTSFIASYKNFAFEYFSHVATKRELFELLMIFLAVIDYRVSNSPLLNSDAKKLTKKGLEDIYAHIGKSKSNKWVFEKRTEYESLGGGIPTSSEQYLFLHVISLLNKDVKALTMNSSEPGNAAELGAKENSGSKVSTKERLLELKELLDDGLIDQSEFDAKRKDIIEGL